MRLVIQRSPDPVPYRGAYFRITGAEGEPGRAGLVLAPAQEGEQDRDTLARLLGLALALGDAGEGGAPIRQIWLDEESAFQGKMGSGISPRHAAEAERLAQRVQREWGRFLDNALYRLRGEARGDAHFRFPDEGWSAEQPATRVIRWPPLPGEQLPELE
jgi:hypothetical protein